MKNALLALAIGATTFVGGMYVARHEEDRTVSQDFKVTIVEGTAIVGSGKENHGIYLTNDGEFKDYDSIKVGDMIRVTFGNADDDIRNVERLKY
jgi:hypothetical protein